MKLMMMTVGNNKTISNYAYGWKSLTWTLGGKGKGDKTPSPLASIAWAKYVTDAAEVGGYYSAETTVNRATRRPSDMVRAAIELTAGKPQEYTCAASLARIIDGTADARVSTEEATASAKAARSECTTALASLRSYCLSAARLTSRPLDGKDTAAIVAFAEWAVNSASDDWTGNDNRNYPANIGVCLTRYREALSVVDSANKVMRERLEAENNAIWAIILHEIDLVRAVKIARESVKNAVDDASKKTAQTELDKAITELNEWRG